MTIFKQIRCNLLEIKYYSYAIQCLACFTVDSFISATLQVRELDISDVCGPLNFAGVTFGIVFMYKLYFATFKFTNGNSQKWKLTKLMK